MQVYKIVNKKLLNEAVVLVEVEAPFIAKKVLPGQFIIFRIDEQGERVPLTVADRIPTGKSTACYGRSC